MSVLMAGRCGALTVLMAINLSGAGQTLRERALKEGHVHAGAIVDYVPGGFADLADLVKHSEIIVRGKVTDSIGRFSHDERQVWTDYTISIQEIYKQGGKTSFAPGAKIQVTRLGGHLFVYGATPKWHPPEPLPANPVEYDVGPSPVSEGTPEIFFIGTCSGPECSVGYTFVPGLGAISLENGQVSCSARPHPVWKPYCGRTADSFISAVKETVASLLAQESSFPVHHDGNWLLQTCKSEDAYTSGECYGYIYATMDRFYWENGGAGTPFFCIPKGTSSLDGKKTVVDFLVRYPEERTKYKAVELIGMALCSSWPFTHLGAADAVNLQYRQTGLSKKVRLLTQESSVRVIPDGNWLLQTCKSEDAYTSGECYGYIYATMDRFYWENGGAGTPFFCIPKGTSSLDGKKTVVDFLVRYPEERTKYKAVELIGLALSNHWPCRM